MFGWVETPCHGEHAPPWRGGAAYRILTSVSAWCGICISYVHGDGVSQYLQSGPKTAKEALADQRKKQDAGAGRSDAQWGADLLRCRQSPAAISASNIDINSCSRLVIREGLYILHRPGKAHGHARAPLEEGEQWSYQGGAWRVAFGSDLGSIIKSSYLFHVIICLPYSRRTGAFR